VVRKRRNAIVLAAVLATMASFAVSAFASGLPKLLVAVKCKSPQACKTLIGVYKVRPAKLILPESYGGTLTITWTSWTTSTATGSGTAGSSGMGVTTIVPIDVSATRVKHGHFTRLTITSTGATPSVEKLHLNSHSLSGWTT
jgi:hypothetical protein